MANETYSVNKEEFDGFLKSISERYDGKEVEQSINDYLHNEAAAKINPAVTGFVPISDRNKTHAKHSNPFTRQENYNLAVKVITDKKFNYLVFPDEGLGTSKGNTPQDFTGRGLEAVTPELLDDMITRITETLT